MVERRKVLLDGIVVGLELGVLGGLGVQQRQRTPVLGREIEREGLGDESALASLGPGAAPIDLMSHRLGQTVGDLPRPTGSPGRP